VSISGTRIACFGGFVPMVGLIAGHANVYAIKVRSFNRTITHPGLFVKTQPLRARITFFLLTVPD
jgi:hypothetical protein